MTVSSIQRHRPALDSVPTHQPGPAGRPTHSGRPAALPVSVQHLTSAAIGRSKAAPSTAQIQARLNAFMERAAGPYRVGGREIQVMPAFRMVGGMNQGAAEKYVARIQRELSPEAYRAVRSDLGAVTAGKGTPEQVRRVTQALIDSPAGKAYSATASGVRELMWDHGIGLDCSGFVHHAFLATRGAQSATAASRYGLGDPLVSGLQAPSGRVFQHVDPKSARAGDVMILTGGSDGTGHKVIVFARHEVPPGTAMHERIGRALGNAPTSHFHMLEVDSSWGAGGRPERGGVERHVWAYDEGSRRWATLEKDSRGQWHAFASQKSGPYDHELQGVYRPRKEN